ncbi:hypothetical protein Hanom_Chr07g00644721 [Helianthus anomalus]
MTLYGGWWWLRWPVAVVVIIGKCSPAELLGEEVTEFVVTRNVMVFRGGGIMVIWKLENEDLLQDKLD